MAHIDCLVDTQPMAREIDTVSTHLHGTTAAVVSMKTAVIQAEKDAADFVCDNVNKGFYTLIHSQISQKIAKLQSDVDSHIMRLNQQKKQLLAIKNTMERDYGMLSQRYTKLFTGLNKNLHQRVYALDEPTMKFALKDVTSLTNRPKLLSATVPVSQNESLALSQKILASNLKNRGDRVISSMSQFLGNMKQQKELTDTILLSYPRADRNAGYLTPVIICESNFDKSGGRRLEVLVSGEGLSSAAQDAIRNTVNPMVSEMDWTPGRVDDEVKNEFIKYLMASDAPKRVKEMANKLFMAQKCRTLKK